MFDNHYRYRPDCQRVTCDSDDLLTIAEYVFFLTQWSLYELEVSNGRDFVRIMPSRIAADRARNAAFITRFGDIDDVRGFFSCIGDWPQLHGVTVAGGVLQVLYATLNMAMDEDVFFYFGIIAEKRGYASVQVQWFKSNRLGTTERPSRERLLTLAQIRELRLPLNAPPRRFRQQHFGADALRFGVVRWLQAR